MLKGKLYMIPTTLGECDVDKILPMYVKEHLHNLEEFIVENSKTARAFLKKMNISTPQNKLKIHVLNKHTAIEEIHSFLNSCRNGSNIGLISEAGCPGVADPGMEITSIAHKEDIQVIPLVGPSSILLALMASGMNGQSFTFNGYLPIDNAERKKKLQYLEKNSRNYNQTQIFIETPYRNDKMVESIFHNLQGNTRLCIACDLSLNSEYIKTKTVNEWKKASKPDLKKRPCIFLIYAH